MCNVYWHLQSHGHECSCDSWPVFLLNHMISKSVKYNISSQLWSWIWLKWAWHIFTLAVYQWLCIEKRLQAGLFQSSPSHQKESTKFYFSLSTKQRLWPITVKVQNYWLGLLRAVNDMVCMASYGHLEMHKLLHKNTFTHVIPRWQGSTQCCTAVSEYIAMAVGVIVVLPSFRRPWTFYLEETAQHR